MSTGSNIQESLLKAIDTMAQRRIDQLQLDKTITAIINSPVGVKNGRKIYKVEYEGGYFNATAQNKDDAYLPRMAVYVQVPQGDFSKEKFILGQASKLATDEQVSVVSATNNSFSIIGKNVINNKAEKMGVYSYHSPIEEEENPDTLNHRFNFLYKKDQGENQVIPDENLNLYKKDATAIMVRAEFMTKLTDEQKKKATGEYGLVFDLVFNNLAAGLGETQYDVFDHFKEIVEVNRVINDETEKLSLDTIDKELNNILSEEKSYTYKELTDTDGYLDKILNDIQELDRVYKNNNQTEYTFAVQDLISKYTFLVQDIKRVEDGEKFRQNMRELHQDWMDETIGQPKEKHVSYYLNSNDMIGNPFSFSSWISQYNIFEIDLENFIRIDSILLYKQGFIEDDVKEDAWSRQEPDILVRDIQVYAMRPLSDNNSGYQLKVESKDTGFVFEGKESDVNIVANATLLREYFEDLTRNSDTTFYWFKQSENIVSPMQSEYSIYGGIGWSEINNQNSTKLKITKEDAPAYENHFRCAAVYMGEEVPIVLRYDFIIYNYAGQRFILQSDLGTDFTFDAGIPTITVYKQEEDNLIELYNNDQYKFKWAIIDGNNQKTFLDTKPELDLTNVTVSNFNSYSNTSKLLKDIKWYRGDIEVTTESERDYATKIKYPMSNIASSANITFECYISYRKEDEKDFYPLGKTELTLNNFKILNANSYRIWIENGDQVFQYDEYGNAPNVDKYKDPIEVLPLKIHLFAPNNIEVQDSSFRTKWYFPTEESLIIYNSDEAEIDPETNNKNMFRGSEIGFNIKELYNNNAFDNQIECQIEFNDQILYAETTLTFTKVGSNGTNGTDMVAKIVPSLSNNILYEQPLTIYVDKSKGNKVFLNTQKKNEAEDAIRITEGVKGILKPLLYQKSTQVDFNNVRWNIAGNTSISTNKTGKYFSLDNGDIFYNKEFINNKYRQQIIKSEIKYNSDQTYYAFYSLPIIEYEEAQNNNRISIRNDTYIKEVLYNSDGRNPLYNHNQGLEILNLPDNCIVSWTACGGSSLSENNPDFKILKEEESGKKEGCYTLFTYEKNKVYIIPNDVYYGANTNNYIKAKIYKKLNVKNNNDVIIEDENKEEVLEQVDQIETEKNNFIEECREQLDQIKIDSEDLAQQLSDAFSSTTEESEEDVLQKYKKLLDGIANGSIVLNNNVPKEISLKEFFDKIYEDWTLVCKEYVEKYLRHYYEIYLKYDILQKTEEETLKMLAASIVNEVITKAWFNIEKTISSSSEYVFVQQKMQEYSDFVRSKVEEVLPQIFSMIKLEYEENEIKESFEKMLEAIGEKNNETTEKVSQKTTEWINEEEVELIATIYAPIHMSLNTFGLASVNAWDGNKVDINEAEDGTGYVMAPQIGAGEKDNNNRFTGILMGKAKTNINTTQEENQVGLFGYAHGYQSIFLDAETGNSYFGLPDGKPLVKKGDDWIIGSDDYNEGRIELKPGDISKIGGWRLGRRSLYYIQGEDTSVDIGKRYNEDYIPTKSGAVRKGDAYNKHHEKDIQEEYPGILLYSGQNPYISIKGRKLYPEIKYNEEGQPLPEQHPDTELLSQDSESYLLDGDSLELQLDPLTPTLFTIFRHNGQPRYKDSEQANPLYPIGSRTFLAGINGKGQLVANGLQNVTKPTDSTSGDQVTTMGINTVPAFGENGDNASYIGLKTNVGDNVISKIFVKNNDDADSTLYLSGSGQRNNEYLRPISLHGKSISLYTSNSSKDNITDSYIKVDQNNISAQLGTENNNLISFNRNSENSISLLNSLAITLNNNEVKKDFSLTTAAQTIKATKIEITNTDTYTVNSTGAININTTGNTDIILNRNTSNDNNKKNNKISIESDNILIKVNDNNLFKIDSKSNNGKSQIITNVPLLDVQNSNGRISILGKSGVTGRTDLGESASQIVIKAQDSTSNNYSVIRLGASNNNYVGLTQNGSYVAGYPFTMLFGADSSGSPHCGSIYVRTSNTGRNSSNLNSNRVELNALGLQVAQGIEINGNLLNDAHESRGQYLIVNGNAQIHNLNSNAVLTADKFSGNGANITNTANGNTSGSANITIQGVGGSGTAYIPKVTMSNGRPSFSQEFLTVNLPSSADIWNAISSNVSSAISSALSSYATKNDLANGLDKKANKGTYKLHGPVDIVSEVYRTTIDFGTPVGQQNLVTDAAKEDPSRYYIELD